MAFINFQPKDYFNTKLYTGNGSTNAITGIGFAPDFVWLKHRGDTHDHNAYDAVRGVTKMITPNENYAESTVAASLTSFDSDGFTLGNVARSNASGGSLVSWNWKANGAGSSNTDGSITSTVSASTASGFSISTYTGTGSNATIGHGLGSAPSVVICKQLNATQQWINYHKAIGATKYLHLNASDASATSSTVWNDTDPTSSVFSVGTAVNCNGSGNTYVAYCFAPVRGFSSMGSYVGNGSTDGNFIYLGFKPAFIMLKKTSGIGDWFINDVKRNPFNVVNLQLYPNLTAAEDTTNATQLDITSTGFKLRGTTSNALNSGNDTYIYMAFSEQSIVSSNGVPATAR
jgi:hypothetical protein